MSNLANKVAIANPVVQPGVDPAHTLPLATAPAVDPSGNAAYHKVDDSGFLKINVAAGGAGGAVTVADGADVTQGALADAAVVTDASGSLSAKLRGLIVVLLRAFALSTPLRVDPVGVTAQPVTVASLPALPANQSTNVAQINGATPLMGAGNTGTGSPRVTIATDQANVPTVPQAGTSGGCSIYSFLSTGAVQAANIKASAGQVHSLHFFNNTATICYVRLYNMTTAPATTDTVVYRALIPANTSGAGFVVPIPPGVVFGTGIGIRVTAAVADNDNTALAANAILGNVFYA